MGVVETDQWLLEHYEKPERLCARFTEHFPISPSEIYMFLVSRGMYRPVRGGRDDIQCMKERDLWNELKKEYRVLQYWLKGPDIPIYILPSDSYNRRIQKEYGGKMGLALSKCLFLFVSPHNPVQELKAVLTHEYHHVCRIHAYGKDEQEYTLLDTMVLEGLAEAAVEERHSSKYKAPWTTYYTKEQMIGFWHRIVKDKQHIKRGEREHEQLLNGLRSYPYMLGYATGYYIVQDCIEHTHFKSKSLLKMSAPDILQEALSFSP